MATSAINVLVVDDEPYVCRLIEDVLASDQFHCASVRSGKEACRLLLENKFDVVVFDLFMPDVSGMDLLKFISSRGLPTQAICITGAPSSQSAHEVLAAGAFDFFEKPFDALHLAESVRRAAESCSGLVSGGIKATPSVRRPADKRLKQLLLKSACALVRNIEAKDPYTHRHSDHVAYYAEQLARYIGVPEDAIESIRIAALLHDIGKIAFPDSVLTKPDRLSRAEFALVSRHPDTGAAILENMSMMQVETNLVRYHHENWDGSGYPAGLSGENIPMGSRIINIAESIDTMLMHRTYKQAYSVDQMLEELERCAGRQFDPDLSQKAIDWCRKNPSKLILPEKTSRTKTA